MYGTTEDNPQPSGCGFLFAKAFLTLTKPLTKEKE